MPTGFFRRHRPCHKKWAVASTHSALAGIGWKGYGLPLGLTTKTSDGGSRFFQHLTRAFNPGNGGAGRRVCHCVRGGFQPSMYFAAFVEPPSLPTIACFSRPAFSEAWPFPAKQTAMALWRSSVWAGLFCDPYISNTDLEVPRGAGTRCAACCHTGRRAACRVVSGAVR